MADVGGWGQLDLILNPGFLFLLNPPNNKKVFAFQKPLVSLPHLQGEWERCVSACARLDSLWLVSCLHGKVKQTTTKQTNEHQETWVTHSQDM